ncbi:MAG: Do family serine endopeptidase [Candidatus Eisenbacteria bacterium]|uniref:Do family serine endopeptidase n=1 Tax=Eiseniibacteriota bacterium TaxID=2212470 RepID=A0A849SGP1_UNCEI|nr:Do family serine endopeptidase [Candidatus Eisenbacteria bacterium]
MIPDSNRRHTPRSYILLAGGLLVAGLVIGLGLSAGLDLQRASSAAKASLGATTSSAAMPESPFVSVVDRALPAVVFIDVRKKVGTRSDDPQEELFRRFFDGNPQQRQQQRVPSSGSGFIVDREGHVLTNNHVVRDADDITVTLNDRRTFKATVVGTDPETDVAVIKIEGGNLPVLPLGDSDKLRVGDWAIAIGNPLGMLRGSVTVGIISARGRSNLNIFGGTPAFQDFIQTDASINFGNSGGPLCNSAGEAIGINTAVNSSGQGIGFAIPINLAKHIADQLVAHGSVTRAWLGVRLAEVTPEIAEGFNLPNPEGVLISDVLRDQPAERAGLRRNDVIVEYDGQHVVDLQKFRLRVADTPVGRTVPVEVLRDGKRMRFEVKLSNRDAEVAANSTPSRAPDTVAPAAGLTVRSLTQAERTELGIQGGVLITAVEPGSPADDSDLQPETVVEEVSGKAVDTPQTFARAVREAKERGKPAVLLVRRGEFTEFVPVRLKD